MSQQYLILSLKWSDGSDDLVWYKPNSAGYTTCLDDAGRFTAKECRETVIKNVTIAVPVFEAYSRGVTTIHVSQRYRDELVAIADATESTNSAEKNQHESE